MGEEFHSADMMDRSMQVLDMMSPGNTAHLIGNLATDEDQQTYRGIHAMFEFNNKQNGKRDDIGRSLEYEAFMVEPVVIELQRTTDKNAPPVVGVGVNGDVRWLPRGVPIRLQRKFLEPLCRKETSFETKPDHDPGAEVGMKTRLTSAQPYGFSVIQDPNPKGRAWLEHLMYGRT